MTTTFEECRKVSNLDDIVVPHPLLVESHARLDQMCERRRNGGALEGACVLIHGPSQAGKTTICRTFEQSRNATLDAKARRLPVINLSLPPKVTRKGFLQALLLRVNDYGYLTLPSSGTESVLLNRAITSLGNLQTELLIIDECHHLQRSDSERYAADVGEMIKSILLSGTCSIAMAGVGDAAEAPFLMNEQLALRADRKIDLSPLEMSDPKQVLILSSFLVDYLKALKDAGFVSNAKALANKEVAISVHQVTKGLFGRVCRLLGHAITEMRARGDDGLSIEDLAHAADILLQHSGKKRNPFREGRGL